MTKISQGLCRGFGVLLTMLLAVTGVSAPAAGVYNGPVLPANDEYILNAATTIKTQKAADNIKGGIRGIDVSKYQGKINWKQVSQDNVNFAFIRATYGTTNDPNFVTNAKEAHANGIKVGAYHYATFKDSDSVKKEAAHFISRLKKVDITYPVVLDCESATLKNMKNATATKLAVQFMDLVKAEGYTVMIYSYHNFFRDELNVKNLGDYNLWIANYLEKPAGITHKIWQHTSIGKVSGIKGNVDINIAYEDMSTNKKLKVDKTVSDSIKNTLNDRYGAGLPLDGLNMGNMNKAIAKGLQTEINTQWDVNLTVDGEMTREAVNHIASVNFTSSTKGNITYLIQAKLFYKGLYTGELTARFDDNTVAAVKKFQKSKGLEVDGHLDAPTLHALLL